VLLLAACATRAPVYNRTWSLTEEPGTVSLAYGVPQSNDLDLLARCEGGTFELVFLTADTKSAVRPGRRSELLIGPPDKVQSVPAWTERSDLTGELTVTARAKVPPVPLVGDWAGERITVAAEGTAMTLLDRPSRAMVEAFLRGCGG
jgi:hypothetical protein